MKDILSDNEIAKSLNQEKFTLDLFMDDNIVSKVISVMTMSSKISALPFFAVAGFNLPSSPWTIPENQRQS